MSNQPESSDSKGTKRDFSTPILEKKEVNYDNSVVDATNKLQNLHLGDIILKASDTNKLDSKPIKIRDRYEVGVCVAVIDGRFLGRIGSIKKIEKHECSMEKHHLCSVKLCRMLDTIHVEDPNGDMFVTQTGCVYPLHVDGKPFVRRDQSWATIIEVVKNRVEQREEEERRQKEEEERRQREEEERRQKKEERRQKKKEEMRQKMMEEMRQKKKKERRLINETGQATT